MKSFYSIILVLAILMGCQKKDLLKITANQSELDSLTLTRMIALREKAMIQKNIELVMPQFSEDATWINSQGYLFQGKTEVEKLHRMFAENDSLDYYYEIGKPKVRILGNNNALAYYSWKMFWFKKEKPADTTFREIGLMTLSAQKQRGTWKWVAITNQHTPWFYKEIEAIKIE